ncbi:MAG: alpha/beta fold hydrolase, partial [Candidatus Eremiobacteraeota bacterium]|nr:alpha/beta fold hydrolase [Candidatus Eremiobacteraeota bacterium]
FLVNRSLTSGLPINHLGGVQRRWRWRGFEIFATESGSGSPALLVHGMAVGSSSYEFRKIFERLAGSHRVVAFDFLGFGLSEKPDVSYTTDLFVEQLTGALEEFARGEPATLIGSGRGAAYAIRSAARSTAPVSHVVAICPSGLAGTREDPKPDGRRAVAPLLATPVLGASLYSAIVSRPALRRSLEGHVYGDRSAVTPAILDHYVAVTHQPGARRVPAALFAGKLDCDVAPDLPFLDARLLVLWGKRAPAFNPARNAAEYVALAKNAEAEYYVRSGLLPHEEEPEAVAARIEAFTRASAAHSR